MGLPTESIQTGVSAIIVNYNAGSFLADCIARVLPQVDEVVVVDNDSQDDSLELLESVLANSNSIKILKNIKNIGFSAACNIGIKNCQAPNLLFLNPDCLLDKNAVLALKDVLSSDPIVGMAGGLLMNPDGSEQPGGRRAVPTPWRSFVRAFGLARFAGRWPRLFFDFHLHEQPLPALSIEVEAISGACMLVKREAMENVGLWDEGYFLHCEDLDWCMRFRQKEWRVMFVPDAKMFHLHGICSRNRKLFVEWHKHKGMMRFYRKFFRHQYPGVLMWLVAAGVWLRFGIVCSTCAGQSILKGLGFVRD